MPGANKIADNKVTDRNLSIGTLSGGLEDENILIKTLNNYNIQVWLEGSVFHDIYVPASRAAMASDILQTNKLTLEHKVHLYNQNKKDMSN